MTIRKISAIILATAVLFGATTAFGAEYKTKITLTVAHASTTDEAYVLTVPADLTLSGSGWNSIGNVNVKHGDSATTQFNPDKKVVVTASSQNGGLTNTSDSTKKISYTFKNSETETGDGSSTLSIEFSASEINTSGGTNKSFGIVVADTSTATNGTYEDYITYTVEVQSAATSLLSLTVYDDYNFYGGSKTFYYVEGETWSQAITNHPTENASWSINGTSVNLSGTTGDVFSSGSAVNANTVIDATKGYGLQ